MVSAVVVPSVPLEVSVVEDAVAAVAEVWEAVALVALPVAAPQPVRVSPPSKARAVTARVLR